MMGTLPQSLDARLQTWLLAGIVGLFVLAGAVYSVVVPLFEAPDEVWHFSFAHYLATSRALPIQSTGGEDVWLREAGQPPLYHAAAAVLAGRFDLSAFPDAVRFNPDHPFVTNYSDSTAPNLFIHTRAEAFPWRGYVTAVHAIRFFTVLLGAATVLGVYFVAREAVVDPLWALAAAAFAAFNPNFIYISSVVNNDTAVSLFSTWAVWAAVRLGKGTDARRLDVLLGLLVGLALLSKLSALALFGLAALAIGVRWWRDRRWQLAFVSGGIVVGVALAISGWWFVRNWALYGDPLGWSVWLSNIGGQSSTLLDLIPQFRDVAVTYWEPYPDLFPGWVWPLLALPWLVALPGWLWLMRRLWCGDRWPVGGVHPVALLLAGVWYLALYASLVRYMLILPAAVGRLLFPATAAIALLVVAGGGVLLRRRAPWLLVIVSAGLLGLSAFTPFLIRERFPPAVIAPLNVPPLVRFAGESPPTIDLLGVAVTPKSAAAGAPVDFTLYWQVVDEPPDGLNVVVRVWTAGGRELFQRDRRPAQENYPPDLWRPGDIVVDPYRFTPASGTTAAYRVEVVLESGDEALARWLTEPEFRVLDSGPLPETAVASSAAFGERLTLTGYELQSATGGAQLRLFWQVERPDAGDVTVFRHVVDAAGNLLAQQDGLLAGGDYPATLWQAGDGLVDTAVVPLPAGAAALQVGLYDPASGERLPLTLPDGARPLGDALVIPLDNS